MDSTVPILLFCILFGLSMDYEVFLLSRIREEWEKTHNNRLAVARGLEMTGGVITNAALLFIIVTGAFTFTKVTPGSYHLTTYRATSTTEYFTSYTLGGKPEVITVGPLCAMQIPSRDY